MPPAGRERAVRSLHQGDEVQGRRVDEAEGGVSEHATPRHATPAACGDYACECCRAWSVAYGDVLRDLGATQRLLRAVRQVIGEFVVAIGVLPAEARSGPAMTHERDEHADPDEDD